MENFPLVGIDCRLDGIRRHDNKNNQRMNIVGKNIHNRRITLLGRDAA